MNNNSTPIPTVIMLPPEVSSPAEVWVAEGKRAACQDLIERLLMLPDHYGPILLLADWDKDRKILDQPGVELLTPVMGEFHFGKVLADLITDRHMHRLAYFGGASAPLVTMDHLLSLATEFQSSEQAFGLVNNYHSTDWGLFNHAERIKTVQSRLPTDNPLGWVLQHEAGYEIRACPVEAYSRADIDTPADLLMLPGHADLGRHLQEFLADAPQDQLQRVAAIRGILAKPASTLALIGRASPHVQLALQRQTQIWVRAFIEERGMIASHRLANGEVRSLVGAMIESWGPRKFVSELVGLCDGALWDTRVWMGHRGGWPAAAERFAADLGWVDQVNDPELRQLSEAISEAPIPILAGGYGVVAGGLYALLECMTA